MTPTMKTITVGLIVFKDIKIRGFSKFCLNKNVRGKNFEVIDNQQNILLLMMCVTHGDKMCDRCEYASVIGGHHIYTKIFYAHAPSERHFRAEENPTMILLSLTLSESSSCRKRYCLQYISDKRLARI